MSTHIRSHLSCYVVVGDDPHLTEVAVGKLLDGLSESSVNEFGSSDELDEILQAVSTPSMFDERRTVVVREVERLGAEAQRKLIGCLQNPAPDATLILVGARMPSQMIKAAHRSGHVIEVEKGRKQDLFLWLRKQASSKNVQVTGEAMNSLIEAVGEQRMALAQAIEELALANPPGTRLTGTDVAAQFRGRADVKLFAFIDAVAQRKTGAALEQLHHLISQGESPIMLFWNLTRHFRMLLVASESSPKQVAKALGLPDWRAEKLVRQARGFSEDDLLRAYQTLAHADLKMKNSEEPEELTLERVVVALGSKR